MKRFTLLLCSLFLCIATYAQKITVSGKVTSGGEDIIGASIFVKGDRTQGTVSSIDGSYSIQVDGNSILTYSFVGYKTAEIPVKNRKTINVELEEDTQMVEEVVITVPYGTAKKSTFTGSTSFVAGGTIEKSQVSNVSKALQGTVAGLQSFSSSGQPGSEATILVRGVGSVNADTNPLYVVDGVPYDGSLSSIASSDIASVTVLKDAASAALYGSRAANGVIMITTKQGSKNSAPAVEISAKYGFSSRARDDYHQLNTNQYFELFWEAIRNEYMDKEGLSAADAAVKASKNVVARLGINPYGTGMPEPIGVDGKLIAGANPLWDDNWDEALGQDAHYTDLNARISGGSQNSRYFFSAGYMNDQGAYLESGFKRYSLRANITSDIRKWLQVGLNVSGTHSIQDYPKQDDSTISNVVLFSRNVPSFYPIYERDLATGAYKLDEYGNPIFDYGPYRASSYAKYNLLASMPHDKHKINRDAASLRGHIQITPLEGLSYKMSLNFDYDNRINHDYSNPSYGPDAATGGSVSKYNLRTTGMTFNNVINYQHTFNDQHEIRLMAGQEYYEFNTSKFGGERSKIIMNGFYEPDAASLLNSFEGNSDQYKLLSFFGSAEYSLAQKYFLSASVRSDGSSRFHPDNRWGTFWSVGGSWKIRQENFMKNTHDWLNNLTLRASYGAQGNDKVGYYAYQALYSIRNNHGESGLHAYRLATPNLSWETNLNTNIGLDFGLWNNRLSGSVEFFERRSKDLLFAKDLVPSSGFSSMEENIGAIKNYGWEFQLAGYPIMTDTWKWKLSFNATTYKNEITSLPAAEMWSGDKKWVKGGSLYDFYMVEWAGVNPENGNPMWYRYDNNGQKITTEDYSSTTTADKVMCGNSLPDWTGGFQSELTYKNFSLSTLFSYSLGGKIYNGDKVSLLSQGPLGTGWSVDMLDRWTPENTETNIPRLTTQPQSSWTNKSSRFLVDRSYLRLKNITFSYNLPKSVLKTLTLKDASIFFQAENMLTLTKEQGLDPEQTFGGETYYRYPTMKTISFGFNVKL